MKDYTGKYVEIREKDGASVTCMLVTEQDSGRFNNDCADIYGYGYCSAKDHFDVATFRRAIFASSWFEVKEITREEFLKRHETAWRTMRAKLTKKTYKQAKKLKQ